MDSSQSGVGAGSTSDGSAGAPSVAESAICESIPSTPETTLDNAPPRFPGTGRGGGDGDSRLPGDDDAGTLGGGWPRLRKLSKDSGTELEEANNSSCDEMNTSTTITPSTPLLQYHGQTSSTPNGSGDNISDNTSTLNQEQDIDSNCSTVPKGPQGMEDQSETPVNSSNSDSASGNGSSAYDVTGGDLNASSSTSTTPTNSIDNAEAPLPGANNNNNVADPMDATKCQNTGSSSTIGTDSNSNPEVPVCGDDSPCDVVTSSEEDVAKNGPGENLQQVFGSAEKHATVENLDPAVGVEASSPPPGQQILSADSASS